VDHDGDARRRASHAYRERVLVAAGSPASGSADHVWRDEIHRQRRRGSTLALEAGDLMDRSPDEEVPLVGVVVEHDARESSERSRFSRLPSTRLS